MNQEMPVPPEGPSPSKFNLSRSQKILVGVLAGLALVSIGTAATFYFLNSNTGSAPKDSDFQNIDKPISPVPEAPDVTPEPGQPVAYQCRATVGSTRDLSGEISWTKPEKISRLGLFSLNSYREQDSEYYKVGVFKQGKHKGADLVLVDAACEGLCFYNDYFRLAVAGDKMTILANHSQELYEGDGIDRAKVGLDTETKISDLAYPEILLGPADRVKFTLDPYVNEQFCADLLEKSFTHDTLGDVYTSAEVIDPQNYYGYLDNNGFYLAAPDGTSRAYKMEIDFMADGNLPEITWSDGTKNKNEYLFTDRGGCGDTNYLSVLRGKYSLEDFVQTGKNKFDEPIYELKDPQHSLLSDVYENQYNPYDAEKVTYEKFLASHPLFFWKDYFGRMVKFQSSQFVPLAECAKPVIYLYPEGEQEVTVEVSPRGGFSHTDPLYPAGGWKVRARPDGSLVELATGKEYPYLFWEGRGGIYEPPQKGFVVAQDEVEEFLKEKLALLGLNQSEISDFVEFWLPKMQSSPYYQVSFLGNSAMNNIAPLKIFPTPGTAIRVLMDFRPLDQKTAVEPQEIVTPARKGFTVVEWGGVLRNQ